MTEHDDDAVPVERDDAVPDEREDAEQDEATTGRPEPPVLPDRALDDSDEGWGERRNGEDRDDDWYERERPPHW